MNERKTETLVRSALLARGYEGKAGVLVEEQQSDNPRIQKLLKRASKAGVGAGYPEFIITAPQYPNLVIVIECKASPKRHRSKELDKPKEYACDGAVLYAAYLSKEFDVIAIGVSGETKSEQRVSVFAHLEGQHKPYELDVESILSFKDLYSTYITSPQKFNVDYADLLSYSQTLNRTLHRLKVKESHRSLLISSILISLKNTAFLASYTKHKTPAQLATSLVKTVIDELKASDVPRDKIENLSHAYAFIQTHTTLTNDPSALVNLIAEVGEHVLGFMETHKYFDTVGQFYIEFLRYANNDKGLGIVLTPPHITELFADIAEVGKDSIVLDSCCGTGGFLISAMKKMVADCGGDSEKIEIVKRTQLLGVEAQHDIYALAISNMILQEDGKSSIVSGDCFKLVAEMQAKSPSVGLLNPPYKAEKDDIEELEFVLNNLEMLESGGICVGLVPISCVVAQEGPNLELKRRLLQSHTLEAVMSLPEDLFHNSKVGVVTCAVVLKAHTPHKKGKKTWLGYWRDDGHVKVKGRGRIDKFGRWPALREAWVQAYRNRDVEDGRSIAVALKPEDEWCAEAYMTVDYSHIDQAAVEAELRRYLAFEILSDEAEV
ncbi:class I SAM-dependent DNA methyltransferase [Uliginosibacterium sp. 31-12]|uniref:HsdM family class I SAM-dependent methyltransferase n=1 Tax=Uliginosibacterium sp. 31-12 TaxID=3062781 RepID=UPI0026E2C497|nr:N-6 DNA methylase [Uliginosibacterium sp. 31-12]MDO6387641.1 N-6 DNA methylase [Uliginosibacterium sp. 31-12]